MKILMINHFPLEGSGSGTYTKNLATQLAKHGHEVCVILPENTPDFPHYEGIRIHPVHFTDPLHPEAATSEAVDFNFPCFTTHPRSTTSFADLSDQQLEQYCTAFQEAIDFEIESFSPDVIHGQHVWILPSLACDHGVPLVLTAHGTDLMGYEKWPHLHAFADRAIEDCEKVICISEDNEELVRATFPEQAHKIVRRRNGYNPDIFKVEDIDREAVLADHGVDARDRNVILFAGKMTRFKGIDVLLDAAAIYEKDLPNAITVLAGDGEEREALERQARELGLGRVFFIGNVSQSELARLYNSADVSVVPSRREPFGLVAVEAMACGTPVVATDQGGLPDFVDREVGELVEPEDATDLARGIEETLERALTDKDWRKRIAAYAESNYSQEVILQELVDLYESVGLVGHR
ncbi:glycosyltransferase [Anaerotardibacter muris]|uniref:glycosyltransferase n=1 Tax=Anaerotardibacter muris TaxID=2941505 RepID=UPI00203B1D7C|nr:glycosyltransferase [Anaerotardibacter muris]